MDDVDLQISEAGSIGELFPKLLIYLTSYGASHFSAVPGSIIAVRSARNMPKLWSCHRHSSGNIVVHCTLKRTFCYNFPTSSSYLVILVG